MEHTRDYARAQGPPNGNGHRADSERIPPHSIEAEQACLASMIGDNGTIGAVARIVQPGDFYTDAHQRLYRAITDLHADGKPVDAVILVDYLKDTIEDVGGYGYLGDLLAAAQTTANAPHYAAIVADYSRRRQLIHLSTDAVHRAYDGEPADELLADVRRRLDECGTSNRGALSFERISTAEFFSASYDVHFHIEDIMVANQPLIIAGGKKNLKTNVLVAASIALASGTPFLGKFYVPHPVNVGLMSGESGRGVLQETGRRIARACDVNAEQISDRLRWCFDLPKVGEPRHMDALERFIVEDDLKVLAIDPAYLAIPLSGDEAKNLFAVGTYLLPLTELGQRTGCTITICHHTKKNIANPFAPPELEDVAWSGFQEWCRQWLLISRREVYDAQDAGAHKLWLNAGGSAGHSSLWALDIYEGSRKDPGGRRWSVHVLAASMAREQAVEQQEDRKAKSKAAAAAKRVANLLEPLMKAMAAYPDGTTRTELRNRLGWSGQVFGPVLAGALDDGTVVTCKVRVGCGKGNREQDGIKLAHRDTGTATPG